VDAVELVAEPGEPRLSRTNLPMTGPVPASVLDSQAHIGEAQVQP